MKLTIRERIHLYGALPREEHVATLKIVRELRESLSFSEEENKKYGITQMDDQLTWNEVLEKKEAPEGFEIPMGEKATDVVVNTLRKIEESGKFPDVLLTVWEKFIKD